MRTTFKWISVAFLATLLLAAIFHRPIFFRLTRYLIVRAAEQQNLAIDYKIDGSIFTNLRFRDLTATPTGPGPIEKLDIQELRLSYSLWGLIREGWPGFLDTFVLRQPSAVIDPSRGPPNEHKNGGSPKFPALIPKRLIIEDLDLIVRQPGDDLVLRGFDLRFLPQQTGLLRLALLQIPGVHTWRNIEAQASYADRNLILREFAAGPEVQVHEFRLDMSRLSGDALIVAANASLFGGNLAFSLGIHDLHETNVLNLQLTAGGIELDRLARYFHIQPPVTGKLQAAKITLRGVGVEPATWSGEAAFRINDLSYGELLSATDADMKMQLADGRAHVERLHLQQEQNDIAATATLELPDTLQGFRHLHGHGSLLADINDLTALSKTAEGQMRVDGKFSVKEGTARADLNLNSKGLTAGPAAVQDAHGTVHVETDLGQTAQPFWRNLRSAIEADVGQLRYGDYAVDSAHFRGGTADGKLNISELSARQGNNNVQLRAGMDLPNDWSEFNPKQIDFVAEIDAADVKQFVADKTGTALRGDLSVKGRIAQRDERLSGALGVSGSNVTYGEWRIDRIAAAVLIQDQTAKLEQLRIAFTGAGKITGTGQYQLVSPHAYSTRFTADLNLARLPLPDSSNWRGNISVHLDSSGTLKKPGGNLEFTANEIDGAALNRLGRVNAKANIKLADQRLSVDATIRQRQTKPLHIVGNVPFDAVRFIREKQFDTSAPVEATITLPRSSIAFLSKMVPQIRYAEGTIALNAKVTGSIRDPELSGSLRVHFPALRAKSTSVPNISDGDVTIRLHDRTVSIEQAQMRIAGGRLSMSGSAQFDELTKPVLDIQIQGKSVLVARNESLNVRANADLSLTGPLAKAKVTGNIGITQSRFLKDIEILPISLPGRPVPRPGLPHESSTASIDTPPLRDWSFDVAIKTDEPFKVRGNLAHGNVVADLKLTGTGKQPSLEGTAWLKDFVVSLPFSRLRITRGSAYFTPGGAIANPKIDLNGVSEIRDHLVNVYVYGTASDPKTVFTSSPPMPQEDIISLLATGVTREEFMANGGRAAAGRASWLALKGLYQKFFPSTPGSSENDFFDRFEFDLGGVDPRTGQQRLVTRFEVSDHWMLVGTTSLEGGFQGKLKYVIRFR